MKKLAMLMASYLVVASALVIYFKAPVRPVLLGGLLVVGLALLQHFTSGRKGL